MKAMNKSNHNMYKMTKIYGSYEYQPIIITIVNALLHHVISQ